MKYIDLIASLNIRLCKEAKWDECSRMRDESNGDALTSYNSHHAMVITPRVSFSPPPPSPYPNSYRTTIAVYHEKDRTSHSLEGMDPS